MENTPLDSQTATQSADNTSTVDAAAKATETPKNTEATQSKGKGLPAFLVLGLISLVAAVVLALTNLLTRGPIEEHAQKALREAFSKVLSAQSYEPIDVDASYGISSLYAAKDGDTVKGYTVTAVEKGYAGDVAVTLGVDTEGIITGIVVGDNNFSETAGFGAKAQLPAFTDQFTGLDGINGASFEAVSGATITSTAVLKAANKALAAVAEAALHRTAVSPALAFGAPAPKAATATANADGSISASAAGFGGDVTVTVTTDASGAVASLTVDTPDETPGLGSKASEEDFTKQFMGKAAPFTVGGNVDAISGATITSEAVVKAINAALGAEPAEAAAATATANADGSISASAAGFGGDVTVTVTTDASGAVASLTVDTPDETPGLGSKASEEDFTKQFMGKTAPFTLGDNVDAISGATITSEAVVKAVNEALASAAKSEEKPAAEATAKSEKTATEGALTASAAGFGGDVTVTITTDASGAVASLTVDTPDETPGLGSKASEEEFTKQFMGKTAPFTLGDNVDAISGATITSEAVVKAVNEALASAPAPKSEEKAAAETEAKSEETPAAEVTAKSEETGMEGALTASAAGFGGDVTVTVTTDASGAVASLTVDTPDETPGLGSKASEEEFTKQFMGKTAPFTLGDNVDAISGATITSEAVVKAVNEALASAAKTEEKAAAETEARSEETPAAEATAKSEETATEGALTASAAGFGGDVTVTVTTDESGSVASLTVDTPDETPGLGSKASEEEFTKQFMGKTAPFTLGDNVDAISGATITSEAVVKAVNEALASAPKTEEKGAAETETKSEEKPAAEATAKSEETVPDTLLPQGYTAVQQGKSSLVRVYFTLGTDGTIQTLTVDASGETPDLGGKTMAEDFTKQFIGKKLPLYAGYSVDTISGATMTSSAVINAVNLAGRHVNTLRSVTTGNTQTDDEKLYFEKTIKGFLSPVTVKYTAEEDGTIASLEVDASNETEGLGTKTAEENFTKQFIGKKPPFTLGENIDAVSGATITSQAVVDLLNGKEGLEYAPYHEGPDAVYTFAGARMGKFSDVYVDADFAEDQTLIALHVNATGETPDRGGRTMEEAFLRQFVGKKAPFELGNGVDAVSGATVTSTAVIEAINEAAKGFDPTVPFSTGK